MKILIMGFTKIKFMPYMNFYLDNIDRKKNKVHILYWNRDTKEENVSCYSDCKLIEFKCYQEDTVSKIKKVNSFIRYRKFALKTINAGDYDFVIALHSLTAVVVADALMRKYKGRYILDYRDSTYESFKPFKNLLASLVKKSFVTFVSSDAFRKFLPSECKSKILTSHNILFDSLDHINERGIRGESSTKIRVAFWGFIRHEELNKIIISRFSNDQRFELHYYGREQQIGKRLRKFAKSLHANNVFFHGEYVPSDRYMFAQQTDIIHNIYYDNNTMLAMGNKYYDGIIFNIPQLCMDNSYMGFRCRRAGVGFECNPSSQAFCDSIYNYYLSINRHEFEMCCNMELNRIIQQYNKGARVIRAIFNDTHI